MIGFRMILVAVLAMVTALASAQERPGQVRPGNAGSVYRHARWNPSVVYLDGNSKARLEVTVNGPVSAVIRSFSPDMAFNDSGLDGDRVAGDNIWTWYGVLQGGSNLHFPNHDLSSIYFDIRHADGSWERSILSPPIGLVGRKKETVTAIDADLFATKRAVFLVDRNRSYFSAALPQTDIDFPAVLTRFYQTYPDLFDFVVIMPVCTIFDPTWGYERTPHLVDRVRNNVQHIGLQVYANPGKYGTNGTLLGAIYHGFGNAEIFDHELGHIWGIFIGNELGFSSNGHYLAYSNIECQMTAYPYLSLTKNADGTWKARKIQSGVDDAGVGYAPLTLYTMGLAPASAVPPVMVLNNTAWPDYNRIPANQFTTFTIDDIQDALGGPRVPAWPTAKKKFRMALIVLTDHTPTAAEGDFFSDIVRFLCSNAKPVDYAVPFKHATGGAGRLSGKLPKVN